MRFDSFTDFLVHHAAKTLFFAVMFGTVTWYVRAKASHKDRGLVWPACGLAAGFVAGYFVGGLVEWWLINGGAYNGWVALTGAMLGLVLAYALLRRLVAQHNRESQE